MFRRTARIVREAQAEIERLRNRLDEVKADAQTYEYNGRRAMRERAAASDEALLLRRENRQLRDQARALDERLAILQAVNEALDVHVAAEAVA